MMSQRQAFFLSAFFTLVLLMCIALMRNLLVVA